MTIRIHHLNCGTMCPFCERMMNSQHGSFMKRGNLVCHCLLIEAPDGLILIDTGLGTDDISAPSKRLGFAYPKIFKPSLDIEETALHQIKRLGFDPSDVKHIVLTHIDLDHAGGLSDFPGAQIHIFKPELDQLLHPGLRERTRFRPIQFSHKPKWSVHEEQGESWFGFSSIRPIPGMSLDILMIPLIGHTMGHTGVAVRTDQGWLLHCGDAYYHQSQITEFPAAPFGSVMFQKFIASIPKARVNNLERLRNLAISQSEEVSLICSHDPDDFYRYQS